MRIVVTNCNTTQAMTKEIEAGARAAASPGTEILARTPRWGPESAEGWLDSFLSAAAVLDLLRGMEEPFDAVVHTGVLQLLQRGEVGSVESHPLWTVTLALRVR
ncbi:aspartate/glutamate racemase family protein, partial [Amycolatopsis sp. NPDC005961]|uniref:aspartate/glutamate racemase family protein n=1 Tax=Amycolatopsis sp. NPDC005961 TaxID=3156720 RepID=UPI0033FCA139